MILSNNSKDAFVHNSTFQHWLWTCKFPFIKHVWGCYNFFLEFSFQRSEIRIFPPIVRVPKPILLPQKLMFLLTNQILRQSKPFHLLVNRTILLANRIVLPSKHILLRENPASLPEKQILPLRPIHPPQNRMLVPEIRMFLPAYRMFPPRKGIFLPGNRTYLPVNLICRSSMRCIPEKMRTRMSRSQCLWNHSQKKTAGQSREVGAGAGALVGKKLTETKTSTIAWEKRQPTQKTPDDHLRRDVTCKHDDDDDRGLPPVLVHRPVEKDTPWISVGAVIGNFYRPQRSWGKVMFSQACVILFTGGVSASMHAGIPPPWDQTPPGSRPSGADTPQADTPLGAGTPPRQTPSGTEHAGRYSQRAGGTHPTGMQSC